MLSLFSDVTELKRDSALFDRVQALAHIGGWEWDAGRNRLYLTDESVRILDGNPTPTSMDAMQACLVEPDRRRLRAAVEHALAEGTAFDLELQGRRSDGHAFWVRAIAEPDAGHRSAVATRHRHAAGHHRAASRRRKRCACRRAPIR